MDAVDARLISTQVTGKDARSFVAARFLDACFAKSADGLRSFLGGLYDVVQPEALMLLSARELELQLCGAPIIDVKAWKRSCVYRGDFDVQRGNPFAPLHPVVQFFCNQVANLFCSSLGTTRTGLAKRRRLTLNLLHAVDAPSTRPDHRASTRPRILKIIG